MVQVIERLHDINVVNKNTTICTSVEGNTETLKPFLSSRIPNLAIEKGETKLDQSEKEYNETHAVHKFHNL